MNWFENYPEELFARIESGAIIEQNYAAFIRELNSFSDERLNSPAIIQGKTRLTYRQMFDAWDDCSRVFGALGITGANRSRIGLISALNISCFNMIYAAAQTGASVSMVHGMDILNRERFENAARKEGITDLILSSDIASPEMIRTIMACREKLSIRNVIVYYVAKDRERKHGPAHRHKEAHYQKIGSMEGVLLWEDLLESYKEEPVFVGESASRETALVFHTSGTTSGIHKPVPLSDRAFNESVARILRDEDFHDIKKSFISLITMEPMAAYAACDMMHLPLAFGGTMVAPDGEVANPATLKLIGEHQISVLFTGSTLMEMVCRLPFALDLSSLDYVILGGGHVSPDARKRYREFFKRGGSNPHLHVGYGLTEVGGAVILSRANDMKDSIGRPLPGVRIKILDEITNTYHDPEEGKQIGVLCISTASLSSGELEGEHFFDLITIDGEKYLNTYDLAEVDEEGNIRIIGRMNKYFINNDGVRFDAGLVETAIDSQPGIEACGISPFFNKLLHDTVPMLYVKTVEEGQKGLDTIHEALCNVYVRDGVFADSNLPFAVVHADRLPLTHTGKVDVHRIQKEHTGGDIYLIDSVKEDGKLTDIKLKPHDKNNRFILGNIPEELKKDIAFMQAHGGMFGRGGKAFKKFARGGQGALDLSGMDPEKICELLKSGALEPEMLGHMLAKMLKSSMQDEEEQKKHKKHHHADFCYRGFGDRGEE